MGLFKFEINEPRVYRLFAKANDNGYAGRAIPHGPVSQRSIGSPANAGEMI